MYTEQAGEVVDFLKKNLKLYLTADEQSGFTKIEIDLYIGEQLIDSDSINITNK